MRYLSLHITILSTKTNPEPVGWGPRKGQQVRGSKPRLCILAWLTHLRLSVTEVPLSMPRKNACPLGFLAHVR